MSIKAIVVDDEKMARTLLSGLIERHCPEIEILELCADLPSGVKAITKHKPDLVFLDIEMPGHSGLELMDFFDEESVDFRIIFTTAYSQYAIQAFKLSAVDYLLKPIEADDLKKAIEQFNKINQKINFKVLRSNLTVQMAEQKIAVASIQSTKFIALKDILFCKADGAYTYFFLKDGQKITASKGLKHYEELLTSNDVFQRCHKSFIINLQYVTEYVKSDGGHLVIDHQHNIPLASERSGFILKKLKEKSSVLS